MLQQRWNHLCEEFGLEGSQQWQLIEDSYANNGLAYHNLNHIEDCLEIFNAHSQLAEDPVSVELAIWFHDIIYDPKKSDNEEQSAEVARDFLRGLPCEDRVADLILATKHASQPLRNDDQFICDIDLSILGRNLASYRKYSESIREEYAWVSEADYRSGRRQVLEAFLQRDAIFNLPPFQELYEGQARENLAWEIAQLGSDIAN